MTDSKILTPVLDGEHNLLTEELVSDYLLSNPDFFTNNSQLVTSLRFADNNRGVVSLVERQQQLQRQKIHLLEEEITALLTVANYNERLFSVYNDLYLNLIESKNLSLFLDCLSQTTTQLLNLASFKLYLTEQVTGSDFAIGHDAIVKTDCSSVIDKRFDKNDYYFGRLQQAEKEQIFADQEVGSVVLIQLSDGDSCLGFVAISSNDAEHFNPAMDTLLLNQFRTLVAMLLVQQLKKVGF
ncbi:DUF484 family protein [Colwelliaceae bacterium BS250]